MHRPTIVSLAPLLLTTAALAQQSQHFVYKSQSSTAGDQFGLAICAAGDIDRDGHTDICVGAYADTKETGYIEVLSGASGQVLRRDSGAAAGDRYGFSVAPAGDVNGDSFPDVIVGAPGQQTTGIGYAHVISGLWLWRGAGQQYLHTFKGTTAGDQYGFAVANAGDVDQDGTDDVMIGARQQGVGQGFVELRSGKTGTLIRAYAGGTAKNFGQTLDNAGDVNKDGVPDQLIGAGFLWRVMSGKDGKQLNETQNQGGKSVASAGDVDNDTYPDIIVFHGNTPVPKNVYVFSGKDWKLIHTLKAGQASQNFNLVAGVGDVNGDGHDDVMVNNGGAGALYPVTVYSGKDASPLLKLTGTGAFGVSISPGGDVNGDGVADVLVGDPGSTTTGGAVHVYSTSPLALASDVHEVSFAKQGVQTLSLAAGAQNAGKLYFLLGSVTGTSPGIGLGQHRLPLNVDPYFSLLLSAPNTPLLLPSLGQLDASGNATAKFTAIPQIPASLVGTTFQHAFVVLSQTPFDLTSNAAPVTLLQ